MIKFGTGGFRGVIGDDFTRENVQTIAAALSSVIAEDHSEKPVVIGYDRRFMSDQFARWMAEVFAAYGVTALLYTEPVPSPCVMCATRDLDADYGVMITASHNPYMFNGVKVFLRGGRDADVAFTDRLERACAAVQDVRRMPCEQAEAEGLVRPYCNLDEYVAGIRAFIRPEIRNNDAKILYDNLCGVGIVGLSRLAATFSIRRFDVLHENHDAFFNFELPNPTQEMLKPLRAQVLAGGYDYAMATDSDGDRLGILNEKGDFVTNNDILACLYYYLVRYRKERGGIVKNCATSVLIDKLARKLGGECYEVDVGFKNISAKMRETDALIGGESSGGLTCRGYVEGKDSAFSASLFMEMRILMDKPVSEIVKEVRAFAGYDYAFIEREIPLRDSENTAALLGASVPDAGRKILHTERFGRNVKYRFENDCWALLRFSGTEPMLRLFAEAETQAEAERIADVLQKFIMESGWTGGNERKVSRAV